MKRCFVIQPFDRGVFDQRFKETYEPAIKAAGFEPYRVDTDLSVRIPIETIEQEIRDCEICFAEISTNNPNVWYELGYAFACKKDVIMVRAAETDGKLPFDIQHRHVIMYKTGSKGDFDALESAITERINGYQKTAETREYLKENPLIETKGLKPHEIILLALLMESYISYDKGLYSAQLKDEMNKLGYNALAASMGLKKLMKINYVVEETTTDHFGSAYSIYIITDEGTSWLEENENQLSYENNETSNKRAIAQIKF